MEAAEVPAPIQTNDELLRAWRWTTRTANVAHLRATDSLGWRGFALGGLSAVLGAIVGLGIFATLQTSHVSVAVRIVAGATAFVAAGSAALFKYLNYSSRVEEHRDASRSYGNLVRQIDQELIGATPVGDAAITAVRTKLDEIDTKSPNVSPAIWAWAVAGVSEERAAWDKGDFSVDATTLDRGAWSRLGRLMKRLFV
jgi:hypothetical protein